MIQSNLFVYYTTLINQWSPCEQESLLQEEVSPCDWHQQILIMSCQFQKNRESIQIYQILFNHLKWFIDNLKIINQMLIAPLFCANLCQKNKYLLNKGNILRQRALVAYAILELIKSFSPQNYVVNQLSIRQLVLNRTFLNSFILSLMNDNDKLYYRTKYNTADKIDLGICQEAYQEVLSAFQINKGFQYNSRIWTQDRMRDVCHQKKIILFPCSITAQFFKMIHNGENRLLSGSKGTGKSFSFMNYAYLSEFMIKYQVSLKPGEQNFISKLIKKQNLGPVRSLVYINIKPKIGYHDYFIQVMQQFQHIYPIQKIKIDFNIRQNQRRRRTPFMSKALTFLSKYSSSLAQIIKAFFEKAQMPNRIFTKSQFLQLLSIAQSEAQKKNIETTCVIDEGNRIYKQFRELQKKCFRNQGTNFQWKNTLQYENLSFYYDLLEIMTQVKSTHFQSIIIYNSQDFQLQQGEMQLKDFLPNIYKQVPLLHFLKKRRHFGNPRIFNSYSSLMLNVTGQIQLFNIFWFELLVHFHINTKLGHQVTINNLFERKRRQHRECFDEEFGLSSVNIKNKDILQIEIWKNQVRHLDIREYFREVIQKQSKLMDIIAIYTLFKSETLIDEDKTSLKLIFRFLKNSIEERRQKQIIKNIKTYINKSKSQAQQFQRVKYLRQIIQKAKTYVQNSKTIHYSNYVKFEYLSKISEYEKKAFVQLAQFGFVEKQSLRFSMNPCDLITVIMDALTDNDLIYVLANIAKQLLTDPKASSVNPSLGKALDKISYPIFKFGYLELNYNQYSVIKRQQGFTFEEKPIQKSFQTTKSYPILGLTNLNDYQKSKQKLKIQDKLPSEIGINGWFDKLVEEADKEENFQKYIAGYPIQYYNVQKRKFTLSENNVAFDNIALRRVSENHKKRKAYEIQLYDWTMGRVSTKSSKNFKQNIQQILKVVGLKADIKCTLLIVAPDYYVSEYFSLLKNNKNLIKPESLFWKRQSTYQIEGIQFKRQLLVTVGQFDQKLPFRAISQNASFSLLMDLFTQIYKYLKKYHASK